MYDTHERDLDELDSRVMTKRGPGSLPLRSEEFSYNSSAIKIMCRRFLQQLTSNSSTDHCQTAG